jgi:hypothetical protein
MAAKARAEMLAGVGAIGNGGKLARKRWNAPKRMPAGRLAQERQNASAGPITETTAEKMQT